MLPPRYVLVAHWLCEQLGEMSTRDVAHIFGVLPKVMSDDFARIRNRSDIFDFNERKVKCKGGEQYLMRVTQVHPYVLDSRRYPRLQRHNFQGARGPLITWHDLLSCSWRQLDDKEKTAAGQL